MIAFLNKRPLKHAWSQVHKLGSPAIKGRYYLPAVALYMLAVTLVTLYVVSSRFERAAASPGVAGALEEGFFAQGERRKLRRFVSRNPDNLLRITGRELALVLKEPELVRSDFPTIVWQYRNEQCILDVYYDSMKDDVLKAPIVYYEIRAREEGVSAEDISKSCIKSF